MKRVFCLFAAVLMMMCPACAQGGIDLEDMSLEELYEIRDAVEARIQKMESAEGLSVYESGSYLVGRDIPAGDYVLIENENMAFSSVTVRTGDSADSSLITYDLVNRHAVIRLREDTWVILSEVTAYHLDEAPDCGYSDGVAGEGAYLTGVQIPAGKYMVSALGKAPLSSYSICSGILGTDSDLLKFEVIEKDVIIDLAQGDYVELSGCEMTLQKDLPNGLA